MGTTTPQPPRPPAPPAAVRSSSNVLGIVLCILGLIIALSCVAVWAGFRILTRGVHVQVKNGGGEEKEVSIKTPFGGIEVNKKQGITEASLGLPIYPGARSMKGDDSASVRLGFPGQQELGIVAGKFETSDSIDKVKRFYQDRLTAEDGPFTREDNAGFFEHDDWDGAKGNFTGRDDEGKTVFKIKRKEFESVVALRSEPDGTRIELVRISHGEKEAN